MTKIRAYLDDQQVGGTFGRALSKYPDRIRSAARQAAEQAAEEIEENGRADIASGGNFGSSWTESFTATVTAGGGNIRIAANMGHQFWQVFEYGANITAKNPSGLLWIPMDPDNKVWPSAYPGRLFRVNRARTEMRWRGRSSVGPRAEPMHPTHSMSDKAPLLMDADSKAVKYFGKPDVTIPVKFHLRQVVREEARRLPLLFKAQLKAVIQGGG